MNKFFNLFNSDSLQERRFKAEYDQLRIKFISDHYLEIEDPEADVITFKNPTSSSEKEIISSIKETTSSEKETNSYPEICRNIVNLLNPKNRSSKSLDTDSKFKLLNAARREEIKQYKNYECDTRITQILIEASKLDAWRKEAVIQLLDKYKKVNTDNNSILPVKASLYEAAYIRDIHFDNIYYKSKIAKKTVGFLNLVLVTLLSTFLIYSAFLEYGFEKPIPFLLGRFSDLWLVVLFGLLGAAFSTLLNLYKGNKLKSSIVKQIDAVNLTVARLIIGASAGLILFIILNSDLIIIKGFNDTVIPNPEIGPRPLTLPMLSLIFVAGFTERLVINFIDKLSAQQKESDQSENSEEKIPSPQPAI